MDGTNRIVSSLLCFLLTAAPAAFAAELCAPEGSTTGTARDGGRVVIRSKCAQGEVRVGPFRFGDKGDYGEIVPGERETTVEARAKDIVGADQIIAVGGDRKVAVARSVNTTTGQDEVHSVGTNANLAVGQIWSVAAGEEIRFQVGKSILIMKKNGEITLQGANILITSSDDVTIDAGGVVTIKGDKDVTLKSGKIDNN